MQKQSLLNRDAKVEARTERDTETEVPDIFTLPPLRRKHMTAQVLQMGPAPFRFIDDQPAATPEG